MKRIAGTVFFALFIFCFTSYQALAASVVIDPGHGGFDNGATGINGLYEKNVNLDTALRLRNELNRRGYQVYLTRDSDTYLGLQQRVDIANAKNADIFISVHANAHPSSSVQGSLVLYFNQSYEKSSYPASAAMRRLTPQSKALAESIEKHMSTVAGTIDRGIVPSSVYVARRGSIPSVLVETAFLSNRSDAEKLANGVFRQKLAVGIADGIEALYPAFSSDIDNHWAKDSILRLEQKGIISESASFHPNRDLTRAEYTVFLDRIFHFSALGNRLEVKSEPLPSSQQGEVSISSSNTPQQIAQPESFSDLSSSFWAYDSLQNAVKLGILKGYNDGTVKPDGSITRAEMVVILDRLLNLIQPVEDFDRLPQIPVGFYFRDVPVDLWSAPSIYRVELTGLISGVSEGMFAPGQQITRAEGAVILDRYLSRSETPGS